MTDYALLIIEGTFLAMSIIGLVIVLRAVRYVARTTIARRDSQTLIEVITENRKATEGMSKSLMELAAALKTFNRE